MLYNSRQVKTQQNPKWEKYIYDNSTRSKGSFGRNGERGRI